MPRTIEENIRPYQTSVLSSLGEQQVLEKNEEAFYSFNLEACLEEAIKKIQQRLQDFFDIGKYIEQAEEENLLDLPSYLIGKKQVIEDLVDAVKNGMSLLGDSKASEISFDEIATLLQDCISKMDDKAEQLRRYHVGNEVARIFKKSIHNPSMFPMLVKPFFKDNIIGFAKYWSEMSLNRDAALRYGLSCRGGNHFQANGNIDNKLLELTKKLIACMHKDQESINVKNILKESDTSVFIVYGSLDERKCFSGIQEEQIEGYGHADFFFCDVVRYILVSAGIPCYSDLLLQDYFANEILPEWFIYPADENFINIFTNWCTKAASLSSHMVMFGSPIYGDKTRSEDTVCRKEWQAFQKGKELNQEMLSLVLISTHKYNFKHKEFIDCSGDPNFLKKCFPKEIEHLAQPQSVVDYRHSNKDISNEDYFYNQKFKTVVQFAFNLINKLTKEKGCSYYDQSEEWRNLFDELKSLNIQEKSKSLQPDQLTGDNSNVASSSSTVLFTGKTVVKISEIQAIAENQDLGITLEQVTKLTPTARNFP